MKIKAGNYYLNSDACKNVWITEESTSEKSGKIYEKRVSGYYDSCKSALKDMIQRKVYETDTTELKEVINTIDTALKDALKILKYENINEVENNDD